MELQDGVGQLPWSPPHARSAAEIQAAAPSDVRVAVVTEDTNRRGVVAGFQSVEEYEADPDAQAPGAGAGIRITLDGLGAEIAASRTRAVPAKIPAGASDLEAAAAGTRVAAGRPAKVLLSEVRHPEAPPPLHSSLLFST